MSNLITLTHDIGQLPEPTVRKPTPPELISGDMTCRSWVQDLSFDGKVNTGIWESTPGVTRALKPTTYEYCLILQGAVEITEDGCEPRIFRAGDSFCFKPGFSGNWKTLETLRKIYVGVTLD